MLSFWKESIDILVFCILLRKNPKLACLLSSNRPGLKLHSLGVLYFTVEKTQACLLAI